MVNKHKKKCKELPPILVDPLKISGYHTVNDFYYLDQHPAMKKFK
jgi:hypothetical protein